MNAFDKTFDRLIATEGGYVNDPRDPGGETKWGISKRAYPLLDIASLTREDARDIYRRDFWEKHSLEQLPPAIAFQAFDFAVNSGFDTAIRKLQEAAGVAEDGHLGPVSLAAIAAKDARALGVVYLALRLRFMAKLAKWDDFGRGWASRIATDLVYFAGDVA